MLFAGRAQRRRPRQLADERALNLPPHPTPPPGAGANPCLHLVMVFGAPSHPSALGACPDDPLDAGPEWSPFDFTLSRFLHASGEARGVRGGF